MAKAKRKPVNVTPITLGGEEMFLKYNLYAMSKLQEKGVNLAEFGGREVTFSEIIKVLWAGLLTYDPSITEDEVAMCIDIGDLQYCSEKITEAIQRDSEVKK